MSTFIDIYNMAKSLTPALDAEQFAFSLNGGVTLRGYRGEVTEGTPLVLLHSINAAPSAMEMRPLFEHYRDKRPVWVPDLPGFGLSDRPDVTYSSGLYARWLAEWLESLEQPADVVALSLTGEFMARAILEQGTKVRSLSLISPTGMGARVPPSAPSGSRVDRFLSSPLVGRPLFRLLTSKPSIRWFLGQAFVGTTPEHMVRYALETTSQPGAHYAPIKFLTFSLFTEEVCHVANLAPRLPDTTRYVGPSTEWITQWHDKLAFVNHAISRGVTAPSVYTTADGESSADIRVERVIAELFKESVDDGGN